MLTLGWFVWRWNTLPLALLIHSRELTGTATVWRRFTLPDAFKRWAMNIADMPPAIIDLEASGFGRGSYPIEVGFVLPDGSSYCSLIRPAPQWKHWDPDAERLHHITRQILASHGKPAVEVASTLNQRLRGRVVYSDAWANDYSWLSLLFDEVDMTPAFRLENLRMILSEQEAALWHPTKNAVLAETPQDRHRASNDARVIQLTVVRIKCRA